MRARGAKPSGRSSRACAGPGRVRSEGPPGLERDLVRLTRQGPGRLRGSVAGSGHKKTPMPSSPLQTPGKSGEDWDQQARGPCVDPCASERTRAKRKAGAKGRAVRDFPRTFLQELAPVRLGSSAAFRGDRGGLTTISALSLGGAACLASLSPDSAGDPPGARTLPAIPREPREAPTRTPPGSTSDPPGPSKCSDPLKKSTSGRLYRGKLCECDRFEARALQDPTVPQAARLPPGRASLGLPGIDPAGPRIDAGA